MWSTGFESTAEVGKLVKNLLENFDKRGGCTERTKFKRTRNLNTEWYFNEILGSQVTISKCFSFETMPEIYHDDPHGVQLFGIEIKPIKIDIYPTFPTLTCNGVALQPSSCE